MKRLSLLTLIFAILSLVFIILLVFLRIKFPIYPLVSYQDVFDILTPLVLIPVYWLLFRQAANNEIALAKKLPSWYCRPSGWKGRACICWLIPSTI